LVHWTADWRIQPVEAPAPRLVKRRLRHECVNASYQRRTRSASDKSWAQARCQITGSSAKRHGRAQCKLRCFLQWTQRRKGGRLCEFPVSTVFASWVCDRLHLFLPIEGPFRWPTWKPPVRTWFYINSTLRTSGVPAFVKFDEIIRPPLHHLDALLPMLAPQIGAAHIIIFHMSQLSFDRVWMPFSAFVEQ